MDKIPVHVAVDVFVVVLFVFIGIAYGLLPAAAAESNGNSCGDTDGNCLVDAADLIFVRNLLGADAGSSADALMADVNSDGKVDLLDLVLVRNRLGDNCADPAFGGRRDLPGRISHRLL